MKISRKKSYRIFAVILTALMTLSLTFCPFAEAFAAGGEAGGEVSTSSRDETSADAIAEGSAGESSAYENSDGNPAGYSDENSSSDSTEELIAKDKEVTAKAEKTTTKAEEVTAKDAVSAAEASVKGIITNIKVTEDIKGVVTVSWDKYTYSEALYYKVTSALPEDAGLTWTGSSSGETSCTFADLKRATEYQFRVEAYGAEAGTVSAAGAEAGADGSSTDAGTVSAAGAEADADGSSTDAGTVSAAGTDVVTLLAEGLSEKYITKKVIFDDNKYRSLGSRTTAAGNMGLSLRTMIGEGNGGYAVAQGAATDGTYAYYMMASSSTQKGRVLKVRMSDGATVGQGDVIDIHHANGMTYDSKRNRLVCVGYGAYRNQITYIDPVSLRISAPEGSSEGQPNVKYSHAAEMTKSETNPDGMPAGSENNGLAAIAYVEKYDVYVARSRGYNSNYAGTTSSANNDIWVFDASTLEAIGHIYTHITGKYPDTYQSMDADEKYVYFLLSPGSGQSHNIILCLDWNSEKILPVVNGEKDADGNTVTCIKEMWNCNDNNSGDPDAVLTIPISHESEGLFHTKVTGTDGKQYNHFYVSEYYGRWIYKTVTKKVKYKVKWKKVKKWYNKKTKKWTTKKPKKKYRGKSKKVWKYKTKTKKVKVKVTDYWARDDYVYDLGVI